MKQNSQISTLITLLQYIFIFLTLLGYLNFTRFWKDESNFKGYKPWSLKYLIPVIVHNFCASMSNYVFNYNMSMGTHIIIKSLGPPITLILGWIFWGKVYGLNKIFGSILIAIGSGLFTINVQEFSGTTNEANNKVGIILLVGLVLVSSMTSLYTAEIYQSKSREVDWKVVMYYNYLVGLLLNMPLIGVVFNSLEMIIKDNVNYWKIFWNLVTQILCVIGVNILTFKLTALTLSLVLIIRRFVSLFISLYLFEIPVNGNGFLGAILVLTGSFIYVLPNIQYNESLKIELTKLGKVFS